MAVNSGIVPLAGMSVLVVDDSPDNRLLIRIFLQSAGSAVECAESGFEGVKMACAGLFHVVLMDIQMPGMDGYEALSSLKDQGYTRPVIALTAHAMKGHREKAIAAGFADHLAKPIDRMHLIATVESYKHAL